VSGRDTVGQPHVRPNQRLKPVHAALNGRTLLQVRGADDQLYDAIDAVDTTGRRIFVRVDSASAAVWLAAALLKHAATVTGTAHDDATRRELVALIRKYTGYTAGAPTSPEGGK
jgi:hypothetical protein